MTDGGPGFTTETLVYLLYKVGFNEGRQGFWYGSWNYAAIYHYYFEHDPAEIFKEQGGADVMEKAKKRECGPEMLSFWQLLYTGVFIYLPGIVRPGLSAFKSNGDILEKSGCPRPLRSIYRIFSDLFAHSDFAAAILHSVFSDGGVGNFDSLYCSYGGLRH